MPPLNVLAIIENLMLEHDPALLNHFIKKQVTAKVYAWSLMESLFSEVFTADKWFIFWDHVLTNEPAFLLCAIVAYNIQQRITLLSLNETNTFDCFYRNRNQSNPIDMKRFVAKTYSILNNTSERMHPRKYLDRFQRIPVNQTYPSFCHNYPKMSIVDAYQKAQNIDHRKAVHVDGIEVIRRQTELLGKLEAIDVEQEETKRLYGEYLFAFQVFISS